MKAPPMAMSFALLLLLMAGVRGADRHGGDFLRVDVGAGPVASGGTGVLGADAGTLAWWNPALLASQGDMVLSFQHQEAFGGELGLDWLSWKGRHRDLPLSVYVLRQAVPDIPISQLLEGGASFEEGGRPVVRREDAADWVLGVATAREVRPGLDGGLALKLIHRDLATLSATGLGLDAGLRLRLQHGLELGASLRDFSGGVLFWTDGQTDWIPPAWALGSAWTRDLPRLRSTVRLELDLRGELEGAVPDRRGHWRKAWLQGGVEWRFLDKLALRAGHAEGDPAAGAGLNLGRWSVDYAWRPHTELGASHLVTVSARLSQ